MEARLQGRLRVQAWGESIEGEAGIGQSNLRHG